HEIEYALRQQRWREIQEVWRRIEWQRKRKLRRRGKLFNKSERNYRGCSDASPKFFWAPFSSATKNGKECSVARTVNCQLLTVNCYSQPSRARLRSAPEAPHPPAQSQGSHRL